MNLKQFFEKNKKVFYISLGFSVFCFGFMLTHYVPNIDEETWLLNETNSITMWLLQKRYTVYLYNLFFTQHGRFVPLFTSVISIFMWNLSGFLFAGVFFDFEKRDRLWLRTLLLCYYGSIPFCMGEAFSFSMLIIPESFGMVLTALAFVMTVKKGRLKDWQNGICIALLLTVTLGIYQALIGVYVTAIAGWCLCRFLEDKSIKRELVSGILFTLISVALYSAVNFIIAKGFGSSTYLADNYMGWTNGESFFFNLFMAFANVGRVSLGLTYQDVYIYGGSTLRVVMILFILFSIAAFFRKRGWTKKLGVLIFTLGIVIAPFALYIALGTYRTQGRMLIALPLSGMVELLLMADYITKGWAEKLFGVITLGILLANASNMNQIYYYNYLVHEQDKNIANEIIYDLRRSGYDYQNKPVVFIGKVEQEDIGIRKSCTLGGSFFAWDDGNIVRMISFLRLEGCVLRMPSAEQIEEGLALIGDMNTYPQENSIIETEDSIVIYLSEPDEGWYKTNLGRG